MAGLWDAIGHRPLWTCRNWHGRPFIGFHRVEASRRWHLYHLGCCSGLMPPATRSMRCCDGAQADHSRRPLLYHRDDVRVRVGDAWCERCARVWDDWIAMPIGRDDLATFERCEGRAVGR